MLLDSFFGKLKGERLYAFAASCLSTVLVQFATFLLPHFHSKVIVDIIVGAFWVVFVFFSIYRQCFAPALGYIVITSIIQIGYCVLVFLFSYYLLTSNLDPRCVLCVDHQFKLCDDPCVPNRLLACFSVGLLVVFAVVNGICVAVVCRYGHHLASRTVRQSASLSNVARNNTVTTDDQSRILTKKPNQEGSEKLLLTEGRGSFDE